MSKHQIVPCSVLAIAIVAFGVGDVAASCNLIPVAGRTYPSLSGRVNSPITAPGKTVRLSIDGCPGGSNGFAPVAADNAVTVTFEPPRGGQPTAVAVPPPDIDVSDCSLPGGRCVTLTFVMPDTTSVLPPYGLAGPARILVRDPGEETVAEIAELSQPTRACDRAPETIFHKFTVLPDANVFADLASGVTTEVLATVDGANNLLVPLDYWGDGVNTKVLAETPGSPIAVFLEGGAVLPAQGSDDPETILDVIRQQDTPSDFVRSFTLDGRPLPPLLRIKADGDLFGTADAVESVLRISKNDGNGGPDLFDVTDRLVSGRGPIVIDTVSVAVSTPVPLESIQASADAVAFARDENREGIDLNADLDTSDLVVQIVDADSGDTTNTGMAVTEVPSGSFAAPALVTAGDLVAFLQAEAAENTDGVDGTDINGDGDTVDNLLRVFDRQGQQLTTDLTTEDSAFTGVVDGRSLAISGRSVMYRAPGPVVQAVFAGPGGFDVVNKNFSQFAISSDGKHAYAIIRDEDALVVFSRDAITGELTFVEIHYDGVYGVDGLGGGWGVAVSPDGGHVYAAGYVDNAVATFDRDESTGELSFVEALFDGVDGVDGIGGALRLAVSSDNSRVYAIGQSDAALAAFDRDPVSGELTFINALFDGVDGVNGLEDAREIVMSPDGAHLYAVGPGVDDGIAAFAHDELSGEITFVDFVALAGPMDLFGPLSVAVSPDGAHVYVAQTGLDSNVVTLSRDTVTGILTVEGSFFGVLSDSDFFAGSVEVSPDGSIVYLEGGTSGGTSVVYTFVRNPSSGALDLDSSLITGVAGVPGVGALDMKLSPGGAHLYLSGCDPGGCGLPGTILGLSVDSSLSVFDLEIAGVLPARVPARRVAAAGSRAAVLTPEVAVGLEGTDLNFDGDLSDTVAQIYDATSTPEVVRNFGLAANRIAISEALVAFTVPEAQQAATDRNRDNDDEDDVLAVAKADRATQATNVGVSAEDIAAIGMKVVFLTSEAAENETDLNNDGDLNDRIIRVYDYDLDEIVEIRGRGEQFGQAAEEFVVGGSLVAFRTSEAAQGGQDLNGDLDTNDAVMQIYNLASGELINTATAAIPCTLPGCDPTIPYKINGDTVSFLTDEADQGADLNGDNDTDDIVLTVFSVNSLTGQLLDTVFSVNSPAGQLLDTVDGDVLMAEPPELGLSPFPDDTGEGTIVLIEAKETEVGQDINRDGSIDEDDIVVLVAGDADGDGTFDDFDSCVDSANGSQIDADGDGLGDGGCDPEPIVCDVAPRNDCIGPTQPGKASILIRTSADGTRDRLFWKWLKGDATTAADLGDPATTSNPLYSLCIYDASVSEQPLVESLLRPGGTCDSRPCWKTAGRGFRHRDRAGDPGGIQAASLNPGSAGKAKIILKGGGVALGAPRLPLVAPITVQFVVRDAAGSRCWQADYSTSIRNSDKLFKAKGD